MFERFAKDAREAVVHAQDEARSLGADRIGPEHVLLGTVRTPDTVAAQALGRLGVDHAALLAAVRALPAHAIDADALAGIGIDLASVRAEVEASFGPGALDAAAVLEPQEGAPAVRCRREEAARGRAAQGDPVQARRIDSGHLLLAVVRLDDTSAYRALAAVGVGPDAAREAVTVAGPTSRWADVTDLDVSTVLRTRAWACEEPRTASDSRAGVLARNPARRPGRIRAWVSRTEARTTSGHRRVSSRTSPPTDPASSVPRRDASELGDRGEPQQQPLDAAVPKSTFATAFGPAPSSAMTVPSPYESCVTRSPTDSCGMAESGRGVAEPKVAPVDGGAPGPSSRALTRACADPSTR